MCQPSLAKITYGVLGCGTHFGLWSLLKSDMEHMYTWAYPENGREEEQRNRWRTQCLKVRGQNLKFKSVTYKLSAFGLLNKLLIYKMGCQQITQRVVKCQKLVWILAPLGP